MGRGTELCPVQRAAYKTSASIPCFWYIVPIPWYRHLLTSFPLFYAINISSCYAESDNNNLLHEPTVMALPTRCALITCLTRSEQKVTLPWHSSAEEWEGCSLQSLLSEGIRKLLQCKVSIPKHSEARGCLTYLLINCQTKASVSVRFPSFRSCPAMPTRENLAWFFPSSTA